MANPNVFDVLGAKKDGYSDKEIAAYLASKTGFDLEGAYQDGYSAKEAIQYLNKTNASAWDTFLQTAKQEVGSEVTGAMQLLGQEPTDTAEESLRRQMASENPVAGVLGTLAGGLVNPSTLLPGTLWSKGVKGVVAAGAAAGAASGFLQPRYEEDDLSRAASTAVGLVGGGVLAGGITGIAALLKKYNLGETAAKVLTKEEQLATDGTKVVDEVANVADTATAKTATAEELNKVIDDVATGNAVPENTIVDTFDPYSLKLPKELQKSAPRYGRDVVGFESDLDRALYIVGNKKELSASDQKFMDWVKESTGISDENIIRDLGKRVKDHVKNTPDKGVIPPSRLEELMPVVQAINPLGDTSASVTLNPFVKAFDVNFPLAADSNAWKALDTNSKLVYNIGRQILEGDASKVTPKFSLKDPNVKTAFDEVIAAVPGIKRKDAGEVMLKYAKTMEDLSKAHGKEWTPTNFKQFVQEGGVTELDRIALAKAGLLDGCNL